MKIFGVVVAVLLATAPSVAASGEENVRDDFGSVSYSNNDGSRDWAGPWVEGGSESGGPNSGQIVIQSSNCSNNKCLRMQGGDLQSVEIARKADLSALSGARLTFDLELEKAALIHTNTFYVHAKGKGSDWRLLDSYGLLEGGGSVSASFEVGHLAGPDFELRFRLDSLIGGDQVFIDRVEIRGQVAALTTTTTSTSTTSTSTSTTSTTSATTTTTVPVQGGPVPSSSTSTTTVGSDATHSPSTTVAAPSESGTSDDPGEDGPETGDITTTTIVNEGPESQGVIGPGAPPRPPPGSGLRVSAVGVMADYRAGSGTDVQVEVLGAELEADFSLAAETFETARIWLAVLSLLIAAAVVSGMDRKRSEQLPI